MSPTRILTGITTSGTPHLGNYVGAIRPAVAASRTAGVESFYFLADYHALIKVQDPARVQRSTLEIAATWLACGLEPDKVWFYRQSDVPETQELTWFLTCVAGKGILNRAHAYKASVDKNREAGEDDDAGISAGLFMYPVLMAADILLFNANKVPVGRDQIQHIEMARDFGQRFNHLYGEEFFDLPEAVIDENVATLPGLDGRKMSKSYDNTIPLFVRRETLKKLIYSIVTDSRAPGEAKDADNSNVFQLYQAFASEQETAAMRQAFADGIAWGEAKQALFERIDHEIAPLRARYEELIARPADIEAILRVGASRLRARYAQPTLARLRSAVGLRDLSQSSTGTTKKAAKASLPLFKQYREGDGRFYFKLVDGDRLLLQSIGHDSARTAGQLIGRLKQEGGAALQNVDNAAVHLGDELVGHLHEGVELAEVVEALAQLVAEDA
ncbi:tryptophan--tRNA ligase [Lysobacter sp. GCM10012299]|uniref:tryptophan--tRNA ligase n=1 Tax=Lysobacter sp. GCM10012299 TaxID=3317333 RepID=UPI003605DA82